MSEKEEMRKMKKLIEENLKRGASKLYAEGYQQGKKDAEKKCRRMMRK